ncbi:MAG: PorV/PorQ family protein [Elusimicrobiales bacterium]|nr:PorV/PorQ family protein [Elusimicrobiales bacterium]
MELPRAVNDKACARGPRRRPAFWAALACLQALLPACASAYGAGTGAANFLKIPVGAKETSLGGSFTAATDNANAVYYNPAGLNLLQTREISFAHNNYIEGMSQHWLSAAYPYKSGVLGFGLNYFSVPPFASYDEYDNRTGNVDARDMALYFSWGAPLGLKHKHLRAASYGVSVKYISQVLDTESGSGYGIDVGVIAESTVENLKFGASLENILSSKITFIKKGARPPLRLKTGAAYGFRSFAGPLVRASLDCILGNDRAAYFAGGLDIRVMDPISVRIGYNALSDISNGLNFGLGFDLSRYAGRNISVDYSFGATYDFGDMHKLGVSYRFGPRRPSKLPEVPVAAPLSVQPKKTPMDYYIDIFNTGNLYQQRAAIAELGVRGGNDSFTLLLTLLKSENPLLVRDAVLVLSNLNSPRVVDPFIGLLKSENDYVRLAAISGLTRFKDNRTLQAVAGRLEDKSPEVRSWAAEVLGKWGDAGGVDPLQEALAKETDGKVRGAIKDALRNIGQAMKGAGNVR